jgi:hypothetical protein
MSFMDVSPVSAVVVVSSVLATWLLARCSKRPQFEFLHRAIRLSRHGIGLSEKKFVRSPREDTPRKFQGPLLMVLAVAVLGGTVLLANFLFLCLFYGAPRVLSEHLELVQTRKGVPWVVSNGELIEQPLTQIHFFIHAVLWVSLTCALYFTLRKLLPRTAPPKRRQKTKRWK